jgi:predicted DNA-binding antitoxin AbrB/MazE fold protein
MSDQTIQAVYHEGVFHPEIPGEVSLPEGQKVELSIKKVEEETQSERAARIKRIRKIIEHFYDDIDDSEIDEIERAILRRVTFVGDENKAQFD